MAWPNDIDVKDAGGITRALKPPNANGRADAVASRPVALSTEDLAAITALNTATGAPGASSATSDTGTFSLIAFVKRGQEKLTSIAGGIVNIITALGAIGDAAWASGNGSVIALLKSIAASLSSTAPVVIDSGVKFVDVTLSTDTAAYASGDLIADAQIVASCVRSDDAAGALHSIMVIDEDDQKAAFTIYLASASASWGTENAAPSISDANARTILGFVDVATADYKDLGGVSVAFKGAVGMAIKPASGTDDVYVAVVNGSGAPIFTATGLKLRLGFLA